MQMLPIFLNFPNFSNFPKRQKYPRKLIQKFFRNFSFPGCDTDEFLENSSVFVDLRYAPKFFECLFST